MLLFWIVACGEPNKPPVGPEVVTEVRAPAKPAAEAESAPLVTLSLLADGPARPGSTVYVGARYTIRPDWHIYWENPGDSGIATEVTLTLPAGWSAGKTQFPGPIRFTSAGDIVNYGYADTVTLLVPVTVPADASPGAFPVSASSRWLVCQDDRCVPGSGTATGSLTVGEPAAGPSPLSEAVGALPRSATDAAIRPVREGDSLRFTVPGATAELFPTLGLEPALRARAAAPVAGGTEVRIDVDRAALGADPRLVVRTESGYLSLNVLDVPASTPGAP